MISCKVVPQCFPGGAGLLTFLTKVSWALDMLGFNMLVNIRIFLGAVITVTADPLSVIPLPHLGVDNFPMFYR